MSLVTPRKAEPEMNLAEFVIRVESLNANVDIPLLRRAFEFSDAAHESQRRASGEPFFNHCIQVALILAEQHLDTATLAAGMIHDVVEDTRYSIAVIKNQFGEEIAQLADQERPDLFVVDQLSYAVSLALYCLSLPFITFCPGHPTYVPHGDQIFGVPYAWPREFRIPLQELQKLREVAAQTDRQFTEIFNAIIQDYDSRLLPIPSAFRFTSSQAILFNYPDFGHLHQEENGVKKVFMGYAFEPEPLRPGWEALLEQADCDGPRVLITLGSFLSAREDVLDRCLRAVKRAYPSSTVIVSAGANVDKLANWQSESVIVEKFVPQKGLLPHVDLVIHHGGCNSFTEALCYGKPMLILPFSSDQFSIGYDAQKEELAECLDPNHFDDEELAEKMALMLCEERGEPLARWQQHVTEGGPDYAFRQIQRAKDAK